MNKMLIISSLFGLFSIAISELFFSIELVEGLWWNILCVGSFVSILQLIQCDTKTNEEKRQKFLSGLFLTSTTIRSIFPRIDVERICFFDHFLSTAFVGRSLATVGEISFSLQISFVVLGMMKKSTNDYHSIIPYIIPPFICGAQLLCWFGITTTNQLFHCFEESIWAAMIAMLIPVLLRISRNIEDNEKRNKVIVGIVGSIIYVIYMILVDVPMYYRRYNENESINTKYFSLQDGLEDSMYCKEVTKSYDVWKEDAVWMFGYFVICSLISVQMVKAEA